MSAGMSDDECSIRRRSGLRSSRPPSECMTTLSWTPSSVTIGTVVDVD